MDSVIHSGTRREYIHVGSGTASMLRTVPEQTPESIFISPGQFICLIFQSRKFIQRVIRIHFFRRVFAK
jgi:hypothetical protein